LAAAAASSAARARSSAPITRAVSCSICDCNVATASAVVESAARAVATAESARDSTREISRRTSSKLDSSERVVLTRRCSPSCKASNSRPRARRASFTAVVSLRMASVSSTSTSLKVAYADLSAAICAFRRKVQALT
jgi:hypothetical protein